MGECPKQYSVTVIPTTMEIDRYMRSLPIQFPLSTLKEVLCQIVDVAAHDFDHYLHHVRDLPDFHRMYPEYSPGEQLIISKATEDLANQLYPIFSSLKSLRMDGDRTVFPYGLNTLMGYDMVLWFFGDDAIPPF